MVSFNCFSHPISYRETTENINETLKIYSQGSSPELDLVASLLLPIISPCVFTLLALTLWKHYILGMKDKSSPLPLPPGSIGLPFVGETLHILFMGVKYYTERRNRYGNIYKTHILGKPTIRVIGAENVRKILKTEHTYVTSQWPTSTRMIMGEGTLSHSSDAQHKTLRKAIVRAFSHRALSSYVPVVQSIVGSFLQKWCSAERVLAYPECKNMTFAVSCRILTGFKMSEREIDNFTTHFKGYVENLFSLPMKMPGFGLSKGLKAREVLTKMIRECVTRKAQSDPPFDFTDALSLMIEAEHESGKLNVADIQEIGLELLFAGHATTSSAATSMIMLLEENPRVVEKMKEELREHGLYERESDAHSGSLTFESINKLSYLSNVIKEVLRVLPPVGGGFRKALQTFEIGGYQVPKDWSVVYSIRETQDISDKFAEKEEFQPERWESERPEKYHYIPFGGGARTCVGQQIAKLMLKVLAIELVRNCQWKLLNSKPAIKYLPVPHPVDNLPVKFYTSN